VACGPGIVTCELAATAREVVAFDLTPEMLAKAQARCATHGLRNVAFKEGSATDLPFAEDYFDAVVSRLSLHHFQDPRRVLGEMRRVARPGGALIIADVTSSEAADKSAVQNAIEVLRDPSTCACCRRPSSLAWYAMQDWSLSSLPPGTSRESSRNGPGSLPTTNGSGRCAPWCARWPLAVKMPA